MEGLDVSNIVVGDRRARHAAAPINYAALEAANSSDDDSSDEEQRHSDSPNNDPASDAGMPSGCHRSAEIAAHLQLSLYESSCKPSNLASTLGTLAWF